MRLFHRLSFFISVVLLCFVSFPVNAQAQEDHTLSGKIIDAQSKEGIIGATIHLLGTTRGTLTNKEGRFLIKLPAGKPVRLRISAIGYAADTIAITLAQNEERTIALKATPIEGRTVTVTADRSREAANAIIRKVIEEKKVWQKELRDYKFNVYSRYNVYSQQGGDTNFISILESSAEGYWKEGKGYSEKIIARKQSANIPQSANRFTLPEFISFFGEEIPIQDIAVPSPLALDAFDHYEYDLTGEEQLDGISTFKIRMEPQNSAGAGFIGWIWVEKNDTSVHRIEVDASDAVTISPLYRFHMEQTYQTVSNKYSLPISAHNSLGIRFQIPVAPAITIEHSAVIYDYQINKGLSDTLFNTKHEVAVAADVVDSIAWENLRMVPLIAAEQEAYNKLAEAKLKKKEETTFSPIGAALSLLINPNLYQYNRVEGSRLQVESGFDNLFGWPLELHSAVAYSFGPEKLRYNATLVQGLVWNTKEVTSGNLDINGNLDLSSDSVREVLLGVGGSIYDDIVQRGKAHPLLINTISSLLFKYDYPDYYRAKGFAAFLRYTPARSLTAILGYREEDQFSLPVTVSGSLFDKPIPFRTNPAINEGRLSSFYGDLVWNAASRRHAFGLALEMEIAPKMANSDFFFSTLGLSLHGEQEFGMLGVTSLTVSASATLSGKLGNQHLFYFEAPEALTQALSLKPFRFFTMRELEYQGDKIGMAFLEHDFRDLPGNILGLRFLEPLDLHWFGFANVGYSTVSDDTKAFLHSSVKVTGDTPYVEAGLGIGNIFNLLRIDAAWRVTHRIPGYNFYIRDTWSFTF